VTLCFPEINAPERAGPFLRREVLSTTRFDTGWRVNNRLSQALTDPTVVHIPVGPPLEKERVRMKELIEYIAKALVDNPDEVVVSEVEGEITSVLELKVAKTDLGKVIGKQGRTARAMRTILSAASTKMKKRAVLEILE
jgi:predicted RNA-binding protein YlqC (UPF0109 family)